MVPLGLLLWPNPFKPQEGSRTLPSRVGDQGLQEGVKWGSNSMVDVYTFWQITSIMRRPFGGPYFSTFDPFLGQNGGILALNRANVPS